jgi:hypothetical protein
MLICDESPKYRFNAAFDEPKIKYDLTTKYELSEAIEIEILEIAANAKPWIIEHNEEL